MEISYRRIAGEEFTGALFQTFDRLQKSERVWKWENGEWTLKPQKYVNDWSDEDKAFLVPYFQRKLTAEGGLAFGAFQKGKLLGFSLLETQPLKPEYTYFNLLELFVTRNARRQGIGEHLFRLVCAGAAQLGAKRLYICANPAEETVAFYRKMGCRDAEVRIARLAEDEPNAYYLEAVLHEAE